MSNLIPTSPWEIAVLRVIHLRGGHADTQHIYYDLEAGNGKFITLSADHLRKTKYGDRPAYQHEVRSVLSNLVKEGYLERESRGIYRLTAEGKKWAELFSHP